MKFSGMHWLGLTTLILISVTIFAVMNFAFNLIFYLTVGGQILLVFAVYKILTDNYETDKTFDDFYEDRPDLGK